MDAPFVGHSAVVQPPDADRPAQPDPLAAEGIIVLDGDGRVSSANAAAEALLGYQAGGLAGRHYDCFWDPRDAERLAAAVARRGETILRDQSGRPVPAAVTVAPTPGAPGRSLSISALPTLDQISAGLANQLRLASVGALAAGVADELNNKLSVITATCNNLLSQVADETLSQDELLRFVQMIDHSAWRAARIVQALRAFSYNGPPEPVEVNLNQMVEEALTLLAHELQRERKLAVQTKLAPELPPLYCHPGAIGQVLVNLLLNARDASPPQGGVIEVGTRLAADGRALCLSVRDNGPGIPPRLEQRIFDPFFTTRPAAAGAGLGLSIAAGIVEQHGGRIEAANHPDGGALLTVTLPVARVV